jgi:hypothetical protein
MEKRAYILNIALFVRKNLKTPKSKWSTNTQAKLSTMNTIDLAGEEKSHCILCITSTKIEKNQII